jgi:hypothetical protein
LFTRNHPSFAIFQEPFQETVRCSFNGMFSFLSSHSNASAENMNGDDRFE